MSYRPFVLVLCFALYGASIVVGQICNSYSCKMELARTALAKEQYKQALDQALGALYYDPAKKNEVDQFINTVYLAIEDKRMEVEKQRNVARTAEMNLLQEKLKLEIALALADSLRQDALAAREEAEINYWAAKEQEAEARKSQLQADSNLLLYRRRSANIVDLYMKEVNRLILEMDYEQSRDTLLVAAGFDNPTRAFRRGLSEIAFWFNETGMPEQAAELFASTKQGLPIPEIDSVRLFLKGYEPAWFDSLMIRYYGEFMHVQGGEFTYGIKTNISVNDFLIGRTEVTFWQFALYCRDKYRSLNPYKEAVWQNKGNEPIINVSWMDAIEYANWLSERFKIMPSFLIEKNKSAIELIQGANGFRLPTEVEWEYAAKGGVNHQYFYYSGSETNNAREVGWVPGNCFRPQPVGRKRPNALGLYDLTGNVWEWCLIGQSTFVQKDILKLNYSKIRMRGGSWEDKKSILRKRNISKSDYKSNSTGFRLLREALVLDSVKFESKKILIRPEKPNIITENPVNDEPPKPSSLQSIVLNKIYDNIFKLEYNRATDIINNLSPQEKQDTVIKFAFLELTFWWNESGNLKQAYDLIQTFGYSNIIEQNDSIRSLIRKINPQFYESLIRRYYGNMVSIDGGRFTFHYKTTTAVSGFNMAQTETTFWQYGLYCESHKLPIAAKYSPEFNLQGNKPITNITWFESIEYANWVSERRGLQPVYRITNGKNHFSSKKIVEIIPNTNGYRLPTETEWEYAGKGGQNYNYSKYAGGDYFNDVAWGPKNCDEPQPVARKAPNALGIYDLSGNVAEWCWDRFNGNQSYPKTFKQNYSGPQTGSKRMIRGGSWGNQVDMIDRYYPGSRLSPYYSNNKTGFRLVSGF